MAVHERSTNISNGKRLARAGAALLLAGSLAAACKGQEAPDSCESPRATSELFPANPAATKDRATWKNGIAIHTEVPTDTNGVVMGYRGRNADEWQDSRPVSPDRANTIAVLVGNGPVSFSVYIEATEGSAACANKPPVTFGEMQPVQPLIDADATLPKW